MNFRAIYLETISAVAALVLLGTLLLGSLLLGTRASAAKELSLTEKEDFLRTLCADLERTERCMTTGTLILNLSLDWIVFDACSWSGERPTMVKCFDRAAKMLAEMTGEDRYLKTMNYCHRFQGDSQEDAIVNCYREGFKYVNHAMTTYQHHPMAE